MTHTMHDFTPFRKVLAPLLPGWDPETVLAAALKVVEPQNITLLGLVVRSADEPLAFGMLAAREMRTILGRLSAAHAPHARVRARVTHAPWPEITRAVQQEKPDLMIIGHPFGAEPLPAELLDMLARPPCDIALVWGDTTGGSQTPPTVNLRHGYRRILIPVRGGPHAELAVRVALSIAGTEGAALTALHVEAPAGEKGTLGSSQRAYRGLAAVLARLPEVTLREIETDDPAGAVLAASREADLVVMGSPARLSSSSLGAFADRIVRESPTDVLMVRTRRAVPAEPADPAMAEGAITLLVDKWLAENTYQAEEFADIGKLLALKAQRGLSISLALPTLNHESAIGKVIRTVKSALYDKMPLLDEIVLVDRGSTDRTREIAADLGVPVFLQHEILPQYGALDGQGDALWKSLYLTRGDLVVWLDCSTAHIQPRFVCGLLGPLLGDSRLQYVKGFGRRQPDAAAYMPAATMPDNRVAAAGEHVADLAVRPLLNLLYPELSGVLPLLTGRCAGRRSTLERLAFPAGSGVHPALLLEIYERCGLAAIAQVDLQEYLATDRTLDSLAETAHAVLQVFLRKLERRHGLTLVDDIHRTMKLVRADPNRLHLELQEAREQVRPPMMKIPEYVAIRSGSEEVI